MTCSRLKNVIAAVRDIALLSLFGCNSEVPSKQTSVQDAAAAPATVSRITPATDITSTKSEAGPPVLGSLIPFQLTDQHHRAFGNRELHGRLSVVVLSSGGGTEPKHGGSGCSILNRGLF